MAREERDVGVGDENRQERWRGGGEVKRKNDLLPLDSSPLDEIVWALLPTERGRDTVAIAPQNESVLNRGWRGVGGEAGLENESRWRSVYLLS